MSAELRILILGQSNTRGIQLADAGTSWPNLVAGALPSFLGSPVSITTRTFFAHVPGSDEYLERELIKHEPDLVILMLTTFSFTSDVLEPGLRRRFGNRAGDVFSRAVNRFDRVTRHRGRFFQAMNRTTRQIAKRVFPASPVGSYEVALEGTVRALEILARHEELETLAFHGFVRLSESNNGGKSAKAALVDRFLEEMRATTRRLHIEFLNLQDLPEARSNRWYFPDGLHVTPEAHQFIAAAVLKEFERGRLLPLAANRMTTDHRSDLGERPDAVREPS
ncbi:MAG: SGNH/GDSL hydrolase family protein [Dehalococcoidia bacterium]